MNKWFIALLVIAGLIGSGWIFIEHREHRIEKEAQLRAAARNNNFVKIEQLVNEGVNIDAADTTGVNALAESLFDGNFEMTKFLLDQGAKSTTWGTPLEFAQSFKKTLSSKYDYAKLIELLEKYRK